jgi:hypothetical protein
MRAFYTILLLGGFGLVGANGFLGLEFFGPHRRRDLPPSVRQTPGAWRTFLHNNGFRGGK